MYSCLRCGAHYTRIIIINDLFIQLFLKSSSFLEWNSGWFFNCNGLRCVVVDIWFWDVDDDVIVWESFLAEDFNSLNSKVFQVKRGAWGHKGGDDEGQSQNKNETHLDALEK